MLLLFFGGWPVTSVNKLTMFIKGSSITGRSCNRSFRTLVLQSQVKVPSLKAGQRKKLET